MADRPYDCLCPKSPVCSCHHWQWFCAGRHASLYAPQEQRDWSAICRMHMKYWLHGGWVTFGQYLTVNGGITHQPVLVSEN